MLDDLWDMVLDQMWDNWREMEKVVVLVEVLVHLLALELDQVLVMEWDLWKAYQKVMV